MPVLHPTLYSLSRTGRSLGTNESELRAISHFYEFWERKFGHQFCTYLTRNNINYNLFKPINELENFWEWLNTKQHLMNEEFFDNNSPSIKYQKTNAKRLQVIIRFFKYLINTFVTEEYQSSSHRDVKNYRRDLRDQMEDIERELQIILKQGGKGTGTYSVYNSIPDLMRHAISVICIPSTTSRPNSRNPFKVKNNEWKQQFIQIRNDLIIRFYFNYGLRRGELMLIDINSIKKSAPTSLGEVKYLLAITDKDKNDDSVDTRAMTPSIKTMYSDRVISLSERDYIHLKGFIELFREKLMSEVNESDQHETIFISSIFPYKRLSATRIKEIFDIADEAITKYYPTFRDIEVYEALPKLTPKVARHTWAYETLKYLYHKEYERSRKISAHHGVEFVGEKVVMDNAVNTLRKMGGWSFDSKMPHHYAKRFFVERANEQNTYRIRDDFNKAKRELEAYIEVEETEIIFDEFARNNNSSL